MEIPVWNGTIALHKYQSQLLGANPGTTMSESKSKDTAIGGRTLLSKRLRRMITGNPVQELLVHNFNRSNISYLCSHDFRSRFPIRGLKQFGGGNWGMNEINKDAVKDKLNVWLLRTQNFWNEITIPLGKSALNKQFQISKVDEDLEPEIDFMVEQTIDTRTPKGDLSPAAVNSIEQFSRLNGLTGRQMQTQFKTHAPVAIRKEARSLLEYCCFHFLARDASDVHPSIKDAAFRRLMFITMLAWQHPYHEDAKQAGYAPENFNLLKRALVEEEAFVRIAPAIAGVADRPTAHHLFRALVGDKSGLSLAVWNTYLSEIVRVHQGRESHCVGKGSKLELGPGEHILCIGASSKRPVLKWNKNIAWLGRLTLTDRALYFEGNGPTQHQKAIRLDLTKCDAKVEKTKVGPFGVSLFDSAVSVSTSSKSEAWILEFVDFHGEMRRDVWHAFIEEIISVYAFIREYGPDDNDPALGYVYGARKGKTKAVTSAGNSIARLQSLQSMLARTVEDPIKILQFSYLKNAPSGDIVYQTLAVEFWGGCLEIKSTKKIYKFEGNGSSTQDILGVGPHAVGSDGSAYLRRWMRSLSWGTGKSVEFWKHNSSRQALVVGRNLVVDDLSLVERAVLICKEKSQMVEKTQATIDAALIKGIPSNIDLFKELMLPFAVITTNFRKLRHWEHPPLTISFLVVAYTLIYKNWLGYIFPTLLIIVAATMLMLKGLKAQGRLGRSFGKVTIQEQPPSNTIQKIIALKEALAEVEHYLQNVNVALLKLRTVVISGQTQVTNEVAFALLGMAAVLLIFPFKYVCAFILLDQFTRELEFRRNMVVQFVTYLKDRWATIPAAPVVVVPYEGDEASDPPEDAGQNLPGQGTTGESSIDEWVGPTK
eukprot:Gb_32896 [translate_table: standard]